MMKKAVRISHICVQLFKNCKRYTQINTVDLCELFAFLFSHSPLNFSCDKAHENDLKPDWYTISRLSPCRVLKPEGVLIIKNIKFNLSMANLRFFLMPYNLPHKWYTLSTRWMWKVPPLPSSQPNDPETNVIYWSSRWSHLSSCMFQNLKHLIMDHWILSA